MWGESSKNCENNCQCSGLITESFKINSGNSATKRKQEEAHTTNYKLKMNPHSLNFKSPSHTPSKRRVLGEIQNSPLFRPNTQESLKSPLYISKNPEIPTLSLHLSKNSEIPTLSLHLSKNSENPSSLYLTNSEANSPLFLPKNSPIIDRILTPLKKSPLIDNNGSPVTTRTNLNLSFKRTKTSSTKISRIFEERSRFKMSNKENFMSERFKKLDVEEETRDCSFEETYTRETVSNWSMTKLNFSDALQTKTYEMSSSSSTIKETFIPEKESEDLDPDFETLHDLEEEFESDNFDQCTKYEIISTDSPDIISRGRSTSRKVESKNFTFGAPLTDMEQSTSFNRPTITATRSLNFVDEEFTSPTTKPQSFSVKKSLQFTETSEDDIFEFTSPATKPQSFSVKKSLFFEKETSSSVKKSLFTETTEVTPRKNPLRHEKSDSSIGSMASFTSPCSSRLRLFTSESTTSMESGFISELDEPFLEPEDTSNSPKMPNFNELLSGPIKDNILMDRNFMKRPTLNRSLSLNPNLNRDLKAKVSLFSKKSQKRTESDMDTEDLSNKRRKSNCSSPEMVETVRRPILQRAFSENHASIMSAVARSTEESDLIGDFSLPCALPLVSGDHSDLKCISCDTLAGLLRGEYEDSVSDYQVIDCRYPYEFEGGHIPGALNLYTPRQVATLLDQPQGGNTKRSILVFHCEFSLERGPKLYRFLRSSDRSKNRDNYPALTYPEIYLLHKGYSTFYKHYPELCTHGYTAMLDPKHTQLLRKHRSTEEPASFFTHHRSKPGYRLMF